MATKTTKIIAGKHKGKILTLPSKDVTRSSKSILKESFFNVVQYDIIDKVFIEAFGGSGSIGLEAISRGAYKSYFVELDKSSYRVLEQNCKTIDEHKCTTILGDTFERVPELLKNMSQKEIILYIDPPFDFRENMEFIYEKTYDLVRCIKNDNIFLIVFEHKTELLLPDELGIFKKVKTKKFGKSTLTYFEC